MSLNPLCLNFEQTVQIKVLMTSYMCISSECAKLFTPFTALTTVPREWDWYHHPHFKDGKTEVWEGTEFAQSLGALSWNILSWTSRVWPFLSRALFVILIESGQ